MNAAIGNGRRQPLVVADRDDAAALLAHLMSGFDPETSGVYLATGNAGAAAARWFWTQALASGVAFASPQGFAETLASEPATTIARLLGLRGPNYTICGDGDASAGAIEALNHDLGTGVIRQGLVVRWDERDGRIALAALVSDICLAAPEGGPADPIVTLARHHTPNSIPERMLDA